MCAHIQGNSPPQLISLPAVQYFDFSLCTGLWAQDFCSKDRLLSDKLHPFLYTVDASYFTPAVAKTVLTPGVNSIRLCYVGTVSYSKLSRQFFDILHSLSQHIDFTFVIVGEPHEEVLIDRSRVPDIDILFTGQVENVLPYLQESDVFIYPLRKTHYGTGEIALLEAMSCSLPVVAFDNIAESKIINSGETGLLCSNVNQFVHSVIELSESPRNREILGQKARQSIIDNNSFSSFVGYLDSFYQALSEKYLSQNDPPRLRSYSSSSVNPQSPLLSMGASCFLESLHSLTSEFEEISCAMFNFFLCRSTHDDEEKIKMFFYPIPHMHIPQKVA